MANLLINGQTYNGVNKVKIPNTNAGQEEFIQPTGALNISENGTFDVSAYASAIVSVAGGGSGITNIYQGTAFPSGMTTLNISFDSSLGTPIAIITWSEAAYKANNRTCGHITFCDMYRLNGIYGTFATALYNDPTNGLVMEQLSHKARGANGEYVFDRANTSNSFSTSDEFNYIVFFKPVGNLSFNGGTQ